MFSSSTPKVSQFYYSDEQLQSYNQVLVSQLVFLSLKSISSTRKLLSLSNFLLLTISLLFLNSPCQSLSKTSQSSLFLVLITPPKNCHFINSPRLLVVEDIFPAAAQQCASST